MKHVLLLEDDKGIALELIESLEKLNFVVTHIRMLAQVTTLDLPAFSLFVLDWNLPDGEGTQLVTRIRADGIHTPILMLTANSDIQYRKKALELGVSDFLGKPFYFHELHSRIEVLLTADSQGKSPSSQVTSGQVINGQVINGQVINGQITSGEIKILLNEMRVFYKSEELTFTKKEFELLKFFVTHPNTVFSRNELLDAIWGEHISLTPRTVDTHVMNLRKKTHSDLFQTVWSSGYRYIEAKRETS